MGGHDEFAGRQKFVCHKYGDFHVATGVSTEIYHVILGTTAAQVNQSVQELFESGAAELADAYEAGSGIEHIT